MTESELIHGSGRAPRRIYVPSHGPAAWQSFLAKPHVHWRTGYSAKTLAFCWEEAGGLPVEIARMFGESAELLLAIPEHKVRLDGGRSDSQNDVFALIRFDGQTTAAMIEGKVNEPFGPTVGEWFATPSVGKIDRMRQLCEVLGLTTQPADGIRYQLLHRTASALIEARRFKADDAAMLVHSFSRDAKWFGDFRAFARLFGIEVEADRPSIVTTNAGQRLRLGWATGNPEYLAR
jgi:hypothetical protein